MLLAQLFIRLLHDHKHCAAIRIPVRVVGQRQFSVCSLYFILVKIATVAAESVGTSTTSETAGS